MTQYQDDRDWELMFPTRCSYCNDLLIWYLYDAVCPTCDPDVQTLNVPLPNPSQDEAIADDSI